MGIFKRIVKTIDKPIEARTIPELIETVPHVNPINSESIINQWYTYETAFKHPFQNKGILHDQTYWVNPNNQTSFNSHNMTHKDFIDWANGTGIVVRGNTQCEKDKFMRYAKAYNNVDMLIFIYAKYLYMIDDDSKTKINYGRLSSKAAINPINMSNRRDSRIIIKLMLESLVRPLLRDIKDTIKWRDGEPNPLLNLKHTHRTYMEAVTRTLATGGHGYFDACNTPCELENLSWSKDLVFAKAYSIYLEEIDPGLVETIIWCQRNEHN
jgi:hypothetical protein